VLDFDIDENLEAVLGENVPIVSTFWGDPATVHQRIAAAGAVHVHAIGSVAEARHAVETGADVIVAQGWEAGGHVRGQVALTALVPAVADAVGDVPVIAAGGIADRRGLTAALALGAAAAWVGTRFLTATEAATHDFYRQRVVDADPADAVYTRCFDGGWPDAPHRALRNSTISAWEAAGEPAAPNRPGEDDEVATDRQGRYRRYEDRIPLIGMTGALEPMALYAGQSAGLVNDIKPAAEIIAAFIDRPPTDGH
jgi:NAD(P)H-dependent flavin oxidoreductase YrpB (nitropropane dioxygenase family)